MQRLKENTEEKLKAIAEHKLQIAGNIEALNGSLTQLMQEEQDLKLTLYLIERHGKELKDEGGYISTGLIDTSKINISGYEGIKAELAKVANENYLPKFGHQNGEYYRGFDAAYQKLDLKNPYNPLSREFQDWNKGYVDGSSTNMNNGI